MGLFQKGEKCFKGKTIGHLSLKQAQKEMTYPWKNIFPILYNTIIFFDA